MGAANELARRPTAPDVAGRRTVCGGVASMAVMAAAGFVISRPARAQDERAAAVDAPPPEVAAALPGARLQGQGTMRFLGVKVYDIRLWSAVADGPGAGAPHALEILYARSLAGARIAERSLTEMRRQGPIDADTATRWLEAMRAAFPDVVAGDRITGLHRPGAGASYYVNGRARAEVRDAAFARMFFGIWLSPSTSEPALRQSLIGGGAR